MSNDGFAQAVADSCRRTVKQARDARDAAREWFVGTHLENPGGHVSGLTIFDQQLRALPVLSNVGGTAAHAHELALGSTHAQFVAPLATRTESCTGRRAGGCCREGQDK